MKEMGIKRKVVLAEGNTIPYACRYLGEAKVWIPAVIKKSL